MGFSGKLINWYRKNKRDLPWRQTKNPYFIWLSEIILQQTRVNQGISYYEKFITNYPTVFDLANSSEENILKDWQGLGYYSRARNLHNAAKTIVSEYNGKFPETYQDILKLKGVGTYTASAIASFCFEEPHAVVDGNVYRFLSRVYGIEMPIDSSAGKLKFNELANTLLDDQLPSEYNQAIMEFGALHCTPKNPNCSNCIYRSECVAIEKNMVNELPIKSKKVKQKNRYFNYLLIRSEDSILLKKRTQNDIWKNLYDFPLIENEESLSEEDIINSEIWKKMFYNTKPTIQQISAQVVHKLSHQTIYTRFWEIKTNEINAFMIENFTRINESDIAKYPVPKLIENYLTK